MRQDQIDQIVTNISVMLDRTRGNMQAVDAVCDSDYLKGREVHSLTAIVYSGFDSAVQNIPDMTIQKTEYGRSKLFMPELYNQDIWIQIYSPGADPYGSEEVKTKIAALGSRFHIIEFEISDDDYQLKKLTLISFDGLTDKKRAKVLRREEIYSR